MQRADRAWLAGIFEGEGSIYIAPRKCVSLKVSMTDRDVIERMQALFPCPTGIRVQAPTWEPRRKTQYVWSLRRGELVREFLETILPWLGERRTAKAHDAFAFLDSRPGGPGAAQLAKTHCPSGHAYEGANLYVRNGKRQCRTCSRDHSRGRMARVRAEAERQPYDRTEPWHGTLAGYSNKACRCDRCKAVNSEYNRAYRQRRKRAAANAA